ncbi:hypothetical protein ASPTUDRAFT_51092 [Aspergillus tubingensis CBS 134.48]|uniref:Uncharacterized protein n=1 Tax=Aspergillus tubingensis (strain CBS 134.48) TaxID=767770 RepID=A0A1L9NG11_ASPTC|nr:hypothetical protein ASPTUDRAFT_51092 [Aspergillus tubingensis CBS 134.48]
MHGASNDYRDGIRRDTFMCYTRGNPTQMELLTLRKRHGLANGALGPPQEDLDACTKCDKRRLRAVIPNTKVQIEPTFYI